MPAVYYLPVEPMECKWSGFWYTELPKAFRREFDEIHIVDGGGKDWDPSKEDTGDTGILHPIKTMAWKMNQLREVVEFFREDMVKKGDIFFIGDIWFPGLETIRYLSQQLKEPVGMIGCLHGGSYAWGDYVEKLPWAPLMEDLNFGLMDSILMSTYYHTNLVLAHFSPECQHSLFRRFLVTGYPVETELIERYRLTRQCREPNIIYSQRFDKQKRSLDVLRFIEQLWEKRKDFNFVITSSTNKKLRIVDEDIKFRFQALADSMGDHFQLKSGLSREEYLRLLGKSRLFISLAKEETFGYSITEAMAAGCTPVVSGGVTHNEILMDDWRFIVSEEEVVEKLSYYLDNPVDVSHYIQRYESDSIFRKWSYIARLISQEVIKKGGSD